jgi:tetratricopeptide (TPR) repeat protein
MACSLALGTAIGIGALVLRRTPQADAPTSSARVVPPAPPLPQPNLSASDVLVREKVEAALVAVRQNPQSAAAWGRLAMTLDVHDLAAEAAPCYEYAAALDPTNHRWPYLYGILLSVQAIGDPLPWLGRATELAPTYGPARHRYAKELLRVGRIDEAVAAANKALAADPNDPHVHFTLARAALAGNDLKAARRHVDVLLAQEPVLQGAHLLAADLSRRLGDTAAAARHDEAFRTTTHAPAPRDPVVSEMEAEKTGVTLSKDRGAILLAEGNLAAAEAEFRRALRGGPAPGTLSGLATVLYRQRRLAEARDAARQAVELDPAYARAYEPLAMAHAGSGEWPAAVDTLRRGLTMTSRDAGLARLLAAILATTPDPAARDGAASVALTEEVIAAGGGGGAGASAQSDPQLLDQLAMGYAAAGRYTDAAETVRKAIAAARQAGMARQVRDMERRLALYLANQPYIERRW